MVENSYIDTLRRLNSGKNTKINIAEKRVAQSVKPMNVKINMSPKRQIIEYQQGRCYMCETSLGNGMCNFTIIKGPDPKNNLPTKEMRAVCMNCFFKLGKDPVKEPKKKAQKVERELTNQELAQMDVDDIIS